MDFRGHLVFRQLGTDSEDSLRPIVQVFSDQYFTGRPTARQFEYVLNHSC